MIPKYNEMYEEVLAALSLTKKETKDCQTITARSFIIG